MAVTHGPHRYDLSMGGLSLLILALAYIVYFWQTIRTGVKPHPFSWLLWGSVSGVAYLAQVSKGEGPGSWVVGSTAVACFAVGCVSLIKFSWRFSFFDWLSLMSGLSVFAYWFAVRNGTNSAVLATTIDLIGYCPTLTKGWTEPHRDSALAFLLNGLKFIPALAALESWSLATALFPATLVFANSAVAVMLIERRRQLSRAEQRPL